MAPGFWYRGQAAETKLVQFELRDITLLVVLMNDLRHEFSLPNSAVSQAFSRGRQTRVSLSERHRSSCIIFSELNMIQCDCARSAGFRPEKQKRWHMGADVMPIDSSPSASPQGLVLRNPARFGESA